MNSNFLKYIIQKEIPGSGIFSAQILSYGPFVRSLFVPVRLGEMRDVALGLSRLGRYPRFLPGEEYICANHESTAVSFTSPDQAGHGTASEMHDHATPPERFVRYRLDGLSLFVEGSFIPDIYFNLMGHGILNILDHRLFVDSAEYMPGASLEAAPVRFEDDKEILDRRGCHPLDFTTERIIADDIRVGHPELTRCHGYNCLYVLRHQPADRAFAQHLADTAFVQAGANMPFGQAGADRAFTQAPAARLTDFYYGLSLEVYTDAPFLLVDTGNHFSGRDVGRGGCIYPVHGGIKIQPLAKEGQYITAEYRFVGAN